MYKIMGNEYKYLLHAFIFGVKFPWLYKCVFWSVSNMREAYLFLASIYLQNTKKTKQMSWYARNTTIIRFNLGGFRDPLCSLRCHKRSNHCSNDAASGQECAEDRPLLECL